MQIRTFRDHKNIKPGDKVLPNLTPEEPSGPSCSGAEGILGDSGTSMDSRVWWLMLLPILTFQRGSHLAAGWWVSSPGIPIVGIVGDQVVLPCQLSQDPIPEVFSVRWIFHNDSRRILVGSFDGKSQEEEEGDGRFQGRVEFFPREFRAGNVSLGLRNVRISDQGSYTCHVSFQDVSQEVSVELEVAAIGDIPTIVLNSRKSDLGLSCRASGWFPNPEILWLDGQGKIRKEFSSPRTTLEPLGLFRIDASMTLPPGSDLEVSCRIVNPRLNVTRESRIRISDIFLPSISSWLSLFLALLGLNLLLISAVFCLLRRSHKENASAVKVKLEREEEKKKVKSVLDGEKAKKRAAKIHFKKRFGRLKTELDFWEARSHAVPVAWNALERILELPSGESEVSAPTFPVHVGREGFRSGKCYWELELGEEQDWVLGVLRENAGCGAGPIPGWNSWALRRSQGQLFSSGGSRGLGKLRGNGSTLGVFLDLDWERLEFYNVETAELLERLDLSTGGDPQGMFFPFVSQGEGIRIRPVPIPLPLKGL
ncbi:butyrophilin subfamily 3 member A2-like [Myiozetetes cayanensis]|uniref:butyrophilin subfamily 3 member A2-like n=1 Tax=Myiozetetes cayanensis TaxID=478635 RepID=UPI00216021B3|nr:butyrophilin subfamily 3 member A2-like [Myiozetetes cayanensis]